MSTLYTATILEHFRNPRNFGDLSDADVVEEVLNPLCGDRIRLALRFRDGAVDEVRFRGDACAISKAATSLLTEMLRGRSLEELDALGSGDLLPMLGAEIPATRMKCALLPLEALRAALAKHDAVGG